MSASNKRTSQQPSEQAKKRQRPHNSSEGITFVKASSKGSGKSSNTLFGSVAKAPAAAKPTTPHRPATKGKGTAMLLSPSRHTSARKFGDGQQKQITIKPFKVKPKVSESFEDTTWEKLREAVVAIHTHKPVQTSLQELFRAVEDLCVQNWAPTLYERLTALCTTHIKSLVAAVAATSGDEREVVAAMQQGWEDHCSQMLDVRCVFLYLDRTYVIQTPNIKALWDLGLDVFRQCLVGSPDLLRTVVAGLIQTITSERNGESIDRSLCSSVVRMLTSLRLYTEHFQPHLLSVTEGYYDALSVDMMASVEVPDYLTRVQQRLDEETERCQLYLDAATKPLLLHCVEHHMLTQHVPSLLAKGFDQLMDQVRVDDLCRLYTNIERVGGLSHLLSALKAFVTKVGMAIVKDEDKGKQVIEDLLDFRQRYDTVVTRAFQSNPEFVHSLKETWEQIMNVSQSKTAEMLAKFADSKLRTGEKGGGDSELETILDRVMILFRHLQAKDVFEAFYKKDLAKRLIMQKSASIDAENAMISKLKTECGSTYTAKLESMFKDVEVSKDIMLSFNDSKFSRMIETVVLDVKVLTTNCWPSYPPCNIELPAELSRYQNIFKQFYLQQHSGRCLQWQHSLSTALVTATFHRPDGKKWKELHVSLYQAVCVLLFNNSDRLSFTDVLEGTRIEKEELRRTLQSLACGKVRVLQKHPKGRDVDDHDHFSVDEDKIIAHKLVRMKVNNIQAKETKEEQVKTHEGVFLDRQYQIDAAVVRIMKTRKQLSHNLLVAQLYQQLKFPVKTQDLKKRIESLIDREYLERAPGKGNVYNYLA